MSARIQATFDGTVFRPLEPVALAPNTLVRLTVESLSPGEPKQGSFLKTAANLNLDGPEDWSSNLDNYLYGLDAVDES
jgi:hypothetical protein